MRIIGVDHGDVRIGLAISDKAGMLARPLRVIKHVARQADAETVARVAADKEAELIVVGLPTDGEGQLGYQARKVQRWVEALRQATTIPIEYWDESFSSEVAESLRRHARGEPNDAQAAAVMLQDYLDSHLPSPDEREAEGGSDNPIH